MIGWAILKRGRVAHAWFYIDGRSGCWSACGTWKRRSQIGGEIDGTIPNRCRACVRATQPDFKRKRGVIY